MNRVFYHYEELEEYHMKMWRKPTGDERKNAVGRAYRLMKDVEHFKEAMTLALTLWPKSCQHNLTCLDMNRIAWLGHAGCCIAANSPEDCTRSAWHFLTKEQQDKANEAAQDVIDIFDSNNKQHDLLSLMEA